MLNVLTTNNDDDVDGCGRKLWEVMDMVMVLMVVMVSQGYTYPQTHQIEYIKYIQLFTCQLYLYI